MRSQLRKALTAKLECGVAERFPSFTLFKKNGFGVIFKTRINNTLTFFIEAGAAEKKDFLLIDVLWNTDDDYHRKDDFSWVHERLANSKGGARLNRLWNCKNGEDFFDLDPEWTAAFRLHMDNFTKPDGPPFPDPTPLEVVLPRMHAIVEDALDKLVAHAVPLFREVAKAHNVPLPDAWPNEDPCSAPNSHS